MSEVPAPPPRPALPETLWALVAALACSRTVLGLAPAPAALAAGLAALAALVAELAAAHEATPAQISLAWMLCKHPWIIPIPGSRKPERLQENLDAAEVELTPEEIARIDELSASLDLMVFGGHTAK